MLAYTTYTEAGGTGKTTLSANLAVAHARGGLDTLVIPLDPQDANLSRLFDVDHNRDSEAVDTLVKHMIGKPDGPFDELIVSREGVDIIPEHNSIAALNDFFQQVDLASVSRGTATKALGGKPIWKQLHRVLVENDVQNRYDVVICDPPATEGVQLYNAITATGSLLLAVEPSPKGHAAIKGLEQLVNGLSRELQTQVGVLGAIPIRCQNTNQQQQVLEDINYTIITKMRQRASLFEGAWGEHCSAFKFVAEERNRIREYEQETLARLDRAARALEQRVNLDPPHPPDPGSLEHNHLQHSPDPVAESTDP